MCGTLFLVISGPRYEPETIHHVSPSFESAVIQADIIRGSEVGKYVDTVSIRAIAVGPGPGVVVACWVASWRDDVDVWFYGPLTVYDEEALVSGRCDWPMGWYTGSSIEWNRTL